jgi:hypothetical protein
VFEWFRRRSRRGKPAAVLGQRGALVEANRYDLADLAPNTVSYLGQVAYFELAVFETLSRAVSESPTLASKEGLSAVAGDALAKHHGIVAELRTLKVDPASAMEPFAASIDRFKELTRGSDWLETLVSVYITGGFLDDFFQRIVGALPKSLANRVQKLIEPDREAAIIVEQLQAAIDADPRVASRLALFGRRLLGDAILLARNAIAGSGDKAHDEARMEPVFTDLIAAHSRRMDALGFTA